MEDPVNVVDEIPEPHRSTFITVLAVRDPRLLATLRNSVLPTADEWRAVMDTFTFAFSEYLGPGHEPDETGKKIDNALGAFMTRWPNDNLAQPDS
jgi:hypothetical protein